MASRESGLGCDQAGHKSWTVVVEEAPIGIAVSIKLLGALMLNTPWAEVPRAI